MSADGRFRALCCAIALSIPTVAVLAMSAWFYAVYLPKLVRDEPARVANAANAVADGLLAGELEPDIFWKRGVGVVRGRDCDEALSEELPPDMTWAAWRPAAKYARTREKRGFLTRTGGIAVWVRDTAARHDDDTVLVKLTDIEARDYQTLFYGGGGFMLLVLVVITVLGVRFFLNYVKERDDFLAATAHDLTTPLVGMRYAIGRDDADARCLCERMIRLVANIKDFLRLGGRRPPPTLVRLDLAKACEEAYAIFREDYRDLFDGRDVPVESDGDLPPALADETMTVQILWNLFGNDLKYAAPFGPVSVRLSRKGEYVCAEFADGGPGLTRSQMRRAFDRYYRARTARESGKGGFGIGLCTAREFARAMGGDLTVRRNEPGGCVFTLALRAAPQVPGALDAATPKV
ncbi:MAG: HAMP domain-containing histidine kinase [Kiritimatiellae bacterium]|nr:HAMP domain-containing histidine kinase [Kiritimatiellia bacterium]